jgi:diguanylate cyclase (GGDEF)-like protein/PAS domain S-box-containing protein
MTSVGASVKESLRPPSSNVLEDREDGSVLLWEVPGNVREHILSLSRLEELQRQNLYSEIVFGNISQGVCLFDSEERLVVCNERYAELYGLSPSEVRVGTPLRTILERRVLRGIYGAAAPESYLASETAAARGPAPSNRTLRMTDGRLFAVNTYPLHGGGWVSTHEDVTELHKAERAAKEAQAEAEVALGMAKDALARLHDALDVMSEAIAIFDAEDRYVLWNRCYAQLYTETKLEVGARFEDVLRQGVYCGQYPEAVGREEQWITERLSRHARAQDGHEQQLSGGRWVRVQERRTADGGSIGVGIDITELKRGKAQLAAQNAHFDAAVNNMTQGLCLFDSEMRVVMANRRYAEIYGLWPSQVAPGQTLRDILEARAAKGHYSNMDAERFIREGIAGFNREVSEIIRLADGRAISVVRRPLPDGGLVSTHEDITDRLHLEARVQHLTDYDSVTDLPKLDLLCDWLETTFACTQCGGVVVLSTDLDRFKEINEVHGHVEADRLVAEIARRFRSCVQDGDIIARVGDDEFVIAAACADPFKYGEELAQKLTQCLRAPIELKDGPVFSGVSIGIAVFPNDGRDADHLLRHADQALRQAQAEGRGRYHFFEHDANVRIVARHRAENDLRCALERNEFALHYQPLINLATNEVSGCEALLRWMRPGHGLVAPADFIPLAESSGLIVPIGRWVLQQACAQAMAWPESMKVSVNLSAIQFKEPDLVQTVVDVLGQSGLDPRRLELEITESVLLRDTERTLQALRTLGDHGVRFALDDFGTGYSSLSYLRKFPFNKIKLDRSFVIDLSEHNVEARAILRAVVQLGTSLGMAITAEGVETDEQLAIVRKEGCTELQGYVFCRPRSPEELLSCGIIRCEIEEW